MFQRIQTVYLFLVFVFSLLYLVFPLATIVVGENSYNLMAYKLNAPADIIEQLSITWYRTILLAALFLIMVLTIITTFKYKKRLFQIKLCKFIILLLLILVVISFFYIDSVKNQLSDEFSYGVGVVFPFVSLILVFMANRAIRKDEALIRSVDRIR